MKPLIELMSVDEQHLEHSLREAALRLDGRDEITLDFSSVRRIDPRALQALEALADLAQEKAVRIVLHGVNIDLYKTLKLLDLTRAFSFRNEEQVL